MLVHELEAVSNEPLAWAGLGAMGLFAAWSLVNWWRCPLLERRPEVSHAEAHAALNSRRVEGPRFLLTMLAGMALTLTGLTLIAEGIGPTLAFYLLLGGVYVMQTEPARRQIREAELRVVAAEALGEEAREAAVAVLRSGHAWLVTLQFILLAAAAVALLAF